jgi:putative transposase
MSASSLRYRPAADRNEAVRAQIVALAHRHRRYGAGMIYLKLRQGGARVNHKRVERLYTEAGLQVRRRRRKKIPVADRQPLARPQAPNEVWSADFVFDRTAEGRVVKCLTIVDDATTEAVAIVPARALGGLPVTRVLDRLALVRGLPRILRTDNGLEFCGRALLTWASDRGVTRRTTGEGAGWTDAGSLCQTARRRTEYSHHGTLNRTATQSGGTSWNRGSSRQRPSGPHYGDEVEGASQLQNTVPRCELGDLQRGPRAARRSDVVVGTRDGCRLDTTPERHARRAAAVLRCRDRDRLDPAASLPSPAPPGRRVPELAAGDDRPRPRRTQLHDALPARSASASPSSPGPDGRIRPGAEGVAGRSSILVSIGLA